TPSAGQKRIDRAKPPVPQAATSQRRSHPGEIISERRATSSRNPGRHHVGIPGRLRRNPHPSSFDRLKQWPVLRRGLSIHDELFVREPRRNAVGSCGAWTPQIAAVGKAENRADVSRYPATAGGLK